MLSSIQIENNKDRYLSLINSIKREGFNKDLLCMHLSNSDFFIAPASTKYHSSFKGGLCYHSLCVYDNLCRLVNTYELEFDEDSLKIVALLHDISKMNYFETVYKNKKIYSENGSKSDNNGRYDWVQVSDYAVIAQEERFLYANREITSEYIIRQYCNLSLEESVAILHYTGGMGNDSVKESVNAIYERYPLALMLHLADMISCNLIENEYFNKERT